MRKTIQVDSFFVLWNIHIDSLVHIFAFNLTEPFFICLIKWMETKIKMFIYSKLYVGLYVCVYLI